ncbi:unnamed protein product [Schistosoma margrebowiei]|uniref:Uncharacterized protein n=1 Tax=Schistosoma margrebowiei TaxID=48269 RepID=A0A183LNV1_9TREM|nr:unnamed protein product [Schistosoma margrebowiei]
METRRTRYLYIANKYKQMHNRYPVSAVQRLNLPEVVVGLRPPINIFPGSFESAVDSMTRDVCRLVNASFVYDSVKLSVVVVEVVSGHNASPLLLLVVLVPLLFISPTAESSDGLALGFGRLRVISDKKNCF